MSKLARSFFLVAIFFGLEKGLGFLRQVMIARQFGLSPVLDAFNAANNIPDLLFALISGGALAVAFIPVLSEYLTRDGRRAMWDVFSRVANLVFLVTAALSLLVAVFADQLVGWRLGIAPGFTAEQQALVISLMRLNLVATLLFSLGGLVIAGLQSNQHFFLPALALSMYDIGTLIGVLILAPSEPYTFGPLTLPAFGLGIYGLVYGTILGAALFLIVQLPGLVRYQFRWAPRINLRHPGVQQVLAMMGPRLITVFFIQFIFLATDNIASRLIAGSVTALVYGWLFMQVPETLIGTAIGTVLLPTLSQQISQGQVDPFRHTMARTIRVLLALTIPSALLLAVVITPVVGILNFDAAGTQMVVWVTRAFLVGLVGHALLEVASRSFYAQQNAKTPMITAGLTALTFVLLAVLLAFRIGAPGIALANSLAFTGQALLLLWLLNRRFGGLFQKVGNTLLRASLGGLLAMLAAYGIQLLPLPSLLTAAGGFVLGALVILPFIWTEIKILVKL
jgi:putative peptidoglycan lipid II flippase